MVQRNKHNINYKKDVVDFSINYSPFKIPDKIFDNVKINSKIVALYPSPYGNSVIKPLANFLNLKCENVIISNGSTEIFFLIPQVFKFKRVLLLLPSFWEYEFTISLNNIKKYFLGLPSENNFELNIIEFEKKIKKVDCVYLCNPNKPTSTYIEKDILVSLIKKYKNKTFIMDETYLLFSEDYNKKTLNHLASKYNNLIVVSSLSKIFGIGGIRIGFCVSSRENIKLLKAKKNPYSLNIMAELILPKVLKKVTWIELENLFRKKKSDYIKKLKRLSGLILFVPQPILS